MRPSTIETLEAKIAKLDEEIQRATEAKRRLEAELRERKILRYLSEKGEKPTRKAISYLNARQYIVFLLKSKLNKGITPSNIMKEYEDGGHKINASTLRGYLLRMRLEGSLVNQQGRWFLSDKKKADESANSRLPGAS